MGHGLYRAVETPAKTRKTRLIERAGLPAKERARSAPNYANTTKSREQAGAFGCIEAIQTQLHHPSKMEAGDSSTDTVHPEVRAHINSLVSAVSLAGPCIASMIA